MPGTYKIRDIFLSGDILLTALLALAVLFLWGGTSLGATPSVEVHLEREHTTLNQPVTLILRISGTSDIAEVVPGESREVRLISRGQSSSIQIVNGVQSAHRDLYYAVVPEKTGPLTIPPLEIRFSSGQSVKTEPLMLEVSQNVSSSPTPPGFSGNKGGSPEERTGKTTPGGPSRKAFVTASLSKERVYAGEPVIYRFSFFRAVPAGESQLSPPDFGNLPWEVLEREEYRTEIDGIPYAVTEIPILLSPVIPGEVTIPPAALEVLLEEQNSRQGPFSGGAFPGGNLFPSSLEDFFNFSPFGGRPYHLETKALSLNVLPLPAWKGVPPFSGLLGSADMRCVLSPREVHTGESLQLTVLVRGKGNMQDLQAPELMLPCGIKSYENPAEESLHPGTEGYEGIRAFSWSLIPLQGGSWDLPPVRLALFDPEAEKYEVLEARLPSFSAMGPSLSEEALTPTPTGSPETPAMTETDKPEAQTLEIPPLQGNLSKSLGEVLPSPSPEVLAILTAFPPVLLGLLLGLERFRKKRNTLKNRLIRQSRKALSRARGTEDSLRKMELLQKALTWAVFARQNRKGELITPEILEHLEDRNLSAEEIEKARILLIRLERVLYGGFAEDSGDLEKELGDMIRRLWK